MISDHSVAAVGYIIKPHGIHGEMSAAIDIDIDIDTINCLIIKVDGIYVPFFINSIRSRGSEAVLIKIDGIDSDTQAEMFAGETLYMPIDQLPEQYADEQGQYASDFIGWSITDSGKEIGRIIDFDDSTENLLFSIENKNGECILVPIADELINNIDADNKIIDMTLPDGLANLNT